MKKLLLIFFVIGFVACSNGNREVNVDSSNVITDSAALKNEDSTSVISANRNGQAQMMTDDQMDGAKVRK